MGRLIAERGLRNGGEQFYQRGANDGRPGRPEFVNRSVAMLLQVRRDWAGDILVHFEPMIVPVKNGPAVRCLLRHTSIARNRFCSRARRGNNKVQDKSLYRGHPDHGKLQNGDGDFLPFREGTKLKCGTRLYACGVVLCVKDGPITANILSLTGYNYTLDFYGLPEFFSFLRGSFRVELLSKMWKWPILSRPEHLPRWFYSRE